LKSVKESKLTSSSAEICQGCPIELEKMLEFTKKLEFEDKPDYEGLLRMVKNLAIREKIDLNDGVYDWGVRAILLRDYP